MITEYGIVTQADPSSAWVKTTRSSACEGCSSRDSCGTQPGKEMTLVVKNTLGVAQGDRVVVGIETRPMLFLAFLLYLFPIICLLIGALAGDALAPLVSMNSSLGGILVGGAAFASAFFVIRLNHSRLNSKDEFKPFLVKKAPAVSHPCQTS